MAAVIPTHVSRQGLTAVRLRRDVYAVQVVGPLTGEPHETEWHVTDLAWLPLVIDTEGTEVTP